MERSSEYDPNIVPDPAEWLELEEGERIELVREYHLVVNDVPEDLEAHASVHVMVENQIAQGLDSVGSAMKRLENGGLDRHESLHAVGAVLAAVMYEFLGTDIEKFDETRYSHRLERLNAKQWRKGNW